MPDQWRAALLYPALAAALQVHHGNGTQHIFEADPSVLYMSLHRYDRCVVCAGVCLYGAVGASRSMQQLCVESCKLLRRQ
jgi:hypothetical protein